MSEDISPNPESSDGDAGTSGAADAGKNKSDTVSRTELEASIRERQKERDKRQKIERDFSDYKTSSDGRLAELESRLRELNDARTSAEEDAAKKAGNIEQLQKTWDTQRSELQKQIEAERAARVKDVDEWKTKHDSVARRYYDNFVEKTLLSELSALSTNEKSSLLHLKADYEFEAVEDEDGNFLGVRAKGSDKPLADLHAEVCAKYRLPFEKNDRANGSGAQPPGKDGAKLPAKLPNGFENWPKEKQRNWFAENKDFKLTV